MLPLLSEPIASDHSRAVRATLLTEACIEDALIEFLGQVGEGDELDIQMFYLSRKPVVDALIEASTRVTRPIRLLLDANKDSFNKEKDGTPNRQVARYLLKEAGERGGQLEVRWYATHGEQNHVKTACVRNTVRGRYRLLLGSCNWTGRNLTGVNMEADVLLDNCPALVNAFRDPFDTAWTNGDGKLYSLPYSAFADQIGPDRKWTLGEKPFLYSTF